MYAELRGSPQEAADFTWSENKKDRAEIKRIISGIITDAAEKELSQIVKTRRHEGVTATEWDNKLLPKYLAERKKAANSLSEILQGVAREVYGNPEFKSLANQLGADTDYAVGGRRTKELTEFVMAVVIDYMRRAGYFTQPSKKGFAPDEVASQDEKYASSYINPDILGKF